MLSGVYCITSKSTGKFYHGSSQDLIKRKARHLNELADGIHHNAGLQKLYDNKGPSDLRFKLLLETTDRDRAYRFEEKLIRKNANNKKCLNLGLSARGGDNLTRNPNREKIVKKMTKSIQRRMDELSSQEKKAIFGRPGELNGMYGRGHTKKTRKLLSEINKGVSRNKGIPKSEEGRANMARAAQLRAQSADYVNSFQGKSHSKATKEILSKVAKERAASGILPSNTRRVQVGKKKYRSASVAAKQLGCVTATILNRVRSKNFPEYKFLN